MLLPVGQTRKLWLRRVLVLGCATLASGLAWVFELPGHRELVNWFYPVRWRALDLPAMSVAFGIAALVLAWLVLRVAAARRHGLALALLVSTILAAQFAALLLVGPNFETAVERCEGGHGAFLKAAHDTRDRALLEVLRAYPEEATEGRLGAFAPSKPPGTFAVYRWIYDLGTREPLLTVLAPIHEFAMSRPHLRAYPDAVAAAIVLFPLLTAFVTLPIVWLGRSLSGHVMVGYWSALIWTSCPAVLVITHHTDGSWYPLLVVTACAAAASGVRNDRVAFSFGGGLVLALAIWSSYGLLPSFGFAIAAQLAVSVHRGPPSELSRIARHVTALGLGLGTGFAALVGSGIFASPLEGYRVAMEYHERWKNGFIGGRWGLTGALEFWAWAGLPLLALFFAALTNSFSRRARAWTLLGGLVLAVHLVVLLYAGCNESARLWLFQLPLFVVVVASDLWYVSARSDRHLLIALVLAAQFALTPITRAGGGW